MRYKRVHSVNDERYGPIPRYGNKATLIYDRLIAAPPSYITRNSCPNIPSFEQTQQIPLHIKLNRAHAIYFRLKNTLFVNIYTICYHNIHFINETETQDTHSNKTYFNLKLNIYNK